MKRIASATLAICLMSLSLIPVAASQTNDLTPAQAAIVATERAFAKLSVEQGVRASFITYFAEDGIGFGPQPYKVKETLSKLPAPATRSTFVLNWAPIFGGVASSGDLGWNTGPTLREDRSPDKKPSQHGMFFSVWKKQSDGNWRVVLDLGISTPSAVAPLDAPFQAARRTITKPGAASSQVDQHTASLLKAEQEFLSAAKSGSVQQAYSTRLTDETRIHRSDSMPIVGESVVRKWLERQNVSLSGEPIKVESASSGDLGYVYGSYEISGPKPEKGYYARVWTRDAQNKWRIVIDVTTLISEK